MRQRVAPIETRTAISRERCAERASSRLATFAQAIRSTKPPRPSTTGRSALIGPPLTRSLKVCTLRLNIFVGVRIVVGQSLTDGDEFGLRLRPRDSGASRPNTSNPRALRC